MVTLAESFQLLQITSDSPIDFRMYGTALAQVSDSGRLTDVAVPAETFQNLICNIVFDTVPYVYQTQNLLGANADSSPSSTIYVLAANPDATSGVSAIVTITFVVLES